ncbi:MAG: hypothetical protein IKL48_02650 [Elusimicrobiaceae bacterium]|nr:hypothetical protein [Elusimicrobiaceae bacterium]
MKKWLVFLLIFCGMNALFAGEWGALRDYPSQTDSGVNGEKYLIHKVLKEEQIVVDLILDVRDVDKREKMEKMIWDSYYQWFAYPAQKIKEQEREEEFADILPLLNKEVSVRFSIDNPDIYIAVVDQDFVIQTCGEGAFGCYHAHSEYNPDIPIIYIARNDFRLKISKGLNYSKETIALHEIGHSLGLSDQYDLGKDATTHSVYHSTSPRRSIMRQSTKLTCDDADGIINLIDIARGTSRGGETGWRSLCRKSKDYYSHGKTLTNASYHIDFNQEDLTWTLMFQDNNGLQKYVSFRPETQKTMNPFSDIAETVLETDSFQRPVRAHLATGEDVYYSYGYDKKIRLVANQAKALLVEGWNQVRKKTRYSYIYGKKYEAYFGGDGEFKTFSAVYYPRKGGALSYEEGENFFERDRYVEMKFDGKRNLKDEFWSEASITPPAKPKNVSAERLDKVEMLFQAENTERAKQQLRSNLLKWYQKVK